MILYVNGDSHSAGVEAGGPNHSYGKHLADALGYDFICDAQGGCSNDRIIRTSLEYLKNNTPDLIVIGWTDWQRTEWELDGELISVNASGLSSVPPVWAERYKQWVVDRAGFDNFAQDALMWHARIWEFHLHLESKNIPHVFFHCWSAFHSVVQYSNQPPGDWGASFLEPYDLYKNYAHLLLEQGFTHTPNHIHFGADAHIWWAKYLLTKL
jgi:hypothetical protein